MNPMCALINAYVPEAGMMSFEDAAHLAVERDIQAAADLKDSAETQFKIEKAERWHNAAATICNQALKKEFSLREKRILAELGYLAD